MTSVRHRALAIVLATAACVYAPARSRPRPANHRGVVMVGEWHHVENGRGPMFQSPRSFRADLAKLDRMGFRPVTARAWLTGQMHLPKGASPVVITFDDSHHDQFHLLRNGKVDPRCAIGIWLDFTKSHPEFPVRATFFAVSTMMWAQPEWLGKKLAMLRGWGCEVADHTVSHPDLSRVGDARVEREIGGCALALERIGLRGPFDFAYPYGEVPRHFQLMKGFTYKKRRISVAAAFLAGSGPSPMPGTKGFSRFLIPRILPGSGVGALDYWLDQVAKGKVRPYVQ